MWRINTRQNDSLIADQTSLFVDRPRVNSPHLGIRLCTGHEKGGGDCETVEAVEVQIPPVHDVESDRL